MLGDPEQSLVPASPPSWRPLVQPLGAAADLDLDGGHRRSSVPRKEADRRSMNDTNTRLMTSRMTAIAQA